MRQIVNTSSQRNGRSDMSGTARSIEAIKNIFGRRCTTASPYFASGGTYGARGDVMRLRP